MAKKATKKVSSKKAKAKRAKAKSPKTTKAKKAKAKPSRPDQGKKAKMVKKKSKEAKPANKAVLAPLTTGAGAKLNGKVGSGAPVTKAAMIRKARRKASPLTGEKLEEFRELLMQRRRELLGSVAQMRAESLEQNRQDAAGNLSKFPTSPADLGSDNYELEFTLSLLESEQELLREIDDALERIEQGVYGICEGTGEAIPRTRLKYEPWTRYTVEYASLLEKGLVKPNKFEEPDES